MTIDWYLILRLVIAGLLGGLVGLERELRAKEAGIRTHFIVALGSALFMLISQFAFADANRFDASRVAAQVVSGIGFIGAGVIIFQKNVVRGVTTAAGLWVVAAIGLAAGAGMYAIAVSAALLTVACLEAMHFIHLKYGERLIVVSTACAGPDALKELMDTIQAKGIGIESYSLQNGRASLQLRVRLSAYTSTVPELLASLDSPELEVS